MHGEVHGLGRRQSQHSQIQQHMYDHEYEVEILGALSSLDTFFLEENAR